MDSPSVNTGFYDENFPLAYRRLKYSVKISNLIYIYFISIIVSTKIFHKMKFL